MRLDGVLRSIRELQPGPEGGDTLMVYQPNSTQLLLFERGSFARKTPAMLRAHIRS
jgi:hypothetical protein